MPELCYLCNFSVFFFVLNLKSVNAMGNINRLHLEKKVIIT